MASGDAKLVQGKSGVGFFSRLFGRGGNDDDDEEESEEQKQQQGSPSPASSPAPKKKPETLVIDSSEDEEEPQMERMFPESPPQKTPPPHNKVSPQSQPVSPVDAAALDTNNLSAVVARGIYPEQGIVPGLSDQDPPMQRGFVPSPRVEFIAFLGAELRLFEQDIKRAASEADLDKVKVGLDQWSFNDMRTMHHFSSKPFLDAVEFAFKLVNAKKIEYMEVELEIGQREQASRASRSQAFDQDEFAALVDDGATSQSRLEAVVNPSEFFPASPSREELEAERQRLRQQNEMTEDALINRFVPALKSYLQHECNLEADFLEAEEENLKRLVDDVPSVQSEVPFRVVDEANSKPTPSTLPITQAIQTQYMVVPVKYLGSANKGKKSTTKPVEQQIMSLLGLGNQSKVV